MVGCLFLVFQKGFLILVVLDKIYPRDLFSVRESGVFLTVKGSIKKDKKTGKYFYVIDMGIDQLTGKRTQKKK
ncbi:hypothetical protein V7068_17830 [Bacillus sp. JJ634]